MVHWLHALHRRLSDRRHRRNAQADAHGHRVALHRLRTLHSGMPSRLHSAGERQRHGHWLGGLVACAGGAGAAALPTAPGTPPFERRWGRGGWRSGGFCRARAPCRGRRPGRGAFQKHRRCREGTGRAPGLHRCGPGAGPAATPQSAGPLTLARRVHYLFFSAAPPICTPRSPRTDRPRGSRTTSWFAPRRWQGW